MTDDRTTRFEAVYQNGPSYNTLGIGTVRFASSDDISGFNLTPSSTLDGSDVLSSPGNAVNYERGTHTVTATAGGVTHTLTLDLGAGGAITSWDRNGTELLNRGTSKQRGLQCGLEWTDTWNGSIVRHAAVQGGDLFSATVTNQKGGHVMNVSETTQGEATLLEIDFLPIEQDPDGSLSVPFVNSNHGGTSTEPVYWNSVPMRLELELQVGGKPDTHRAKVYAFPTWSASTFEFDVNLYLIGFFNTSEFTRVLRYDGMAQNVVTIANDFEPAMMDSERISVDNTTPDTVVVQDKAMVSVNGATDGDQAFGIGQKLTGDDKSGDRVLGDPSHGNAFRWVQKTSGSDGPTADNFFAIAYGHHLSNRIHDPAAKRTIAQPMASTEMFLFTGTNTANQAAFDSAV